MSGGYYLFWLAELCIGALVGVCAVKQTPMRGFAIALLLGWTGVVELIVVVVQKLNRTDMNFVGQVIGLMAFGFLLWVFLLLFACMGYWSAFWTSGRLGVGGGWQFNIPALFALVAIYAVIAAIATTM